MAHSTVAVALRRLEQAGLLERVRRQAGLVHHSNAYVFPKSGFQPQTTTAKKPNPLSARAVPVAAAAAEPLPIAVVLARVRAALRADHEAIVRNRAARQARHAAAG